MFMTQVGGVEALHLIENMNGYFNKNVGVVSMGVGATVQACADREMLGGGKMGGQGDMKG